MQKEIIIFFMNYILPIALLIASNIAMTFAWYGHLKYLEKRSLIAAILISWSILLIEYCLQVPANRIAFFSHTYSLKQLKILQEVITLFVFIPFAIFVMKEPISIDFFLASLCLIGAVYFIFR